jgi:hypothetical protein
MDQRHNRSASLRALILHDGTEEFQAVLRRLESAERDLRCLRRAVLLTGLLAALSLSGIGYGTLLLPEVVSQVPSVLVQVLYALAMSSLVSMLVFGGLWTHRRCTEKRTHEKCRVHAREIQESRSSES